MNKFQKNIFLVLLFGQTILINLFGQVDDSILMNEKSIDYILKAKNHFNNDEVDLVKANFQDFYKQLERHPRRNPVDDWVDSCYTFANSIYDTRDYRLLIEILAPLYSANPQIVENRYYQEIGKLLNFLAIAYKREGNAKESININLKILDYFKQCKSLPQKSLYSLYINIGNAYRKNGDYGEVDTYFDEALKLIDRLLTEVSLPMSERKSISGHKAAVYNSIGLSKQGLGKHDEALDAFKNSMKLAEEWDTTRIPRINNNMGVSYRVQNDTANALIHFKNATDIYKSRELDNSGVLYTLNYTDWLMRLDSAQSEKAYDMINHVIAEGPTIQGITELQLATAHFQLGTMLSERNNYKSAINNIDKGLNLLTGVGREQINPGQIPFITLDNSPNQVIEGIKFRARAFLDWANYTRDSSKYIISLENYQLAETCIDSLRNIYVEEESKNNLSRIAKETYAEKLDVLWSVLPSSNYSSIAKKAYMSIEKGKAASLWNIIQTTETKNLSLPPEIVEEEKQLRREIADIQNKIFESGLAEGQNLDSLEDLKFLKNSKLDILTRSINQNYSGLKPANKPDSSPSLDEVQNRLSDDEVMINYFFSDEMLHQVFVSSDSIIYRAIPNANKIRAQVEDFSKMLKLTKYDYSKTDVYNYQKLAWELYKELVHHFDNLIVGKKVIILPDGLLALIPFEALIITEPFRPEPDFKELSYFIIKNQISYSYNAALWAYRKSNHESAKKNVLAIAPSYERTKIQSDPLWKNWGPMLPELEGTLQEVQLIKDNYQSETYKKKRATEKHFKDKAGDFEILHLAMHSIMDKAKPDNSFLAFSPLADRTENGRLYANEIRNLDLNASLTILSACNSGTGELIDGEGVLSLTRTFILAGSSSVIMTLWSVDDQTSMELIDRFYSDMALDMSVAEALQSSKIFYIENANKLYAHPYFWAGFIQMGQDTRIELKKKSKMWPWYAGGAILLGFILILVLPKNTKPRSG